MSVSSGSSLHGDNDHDLLLDEEEELDFYAVLNVPRDATEDEINKAYRKRCLIFHPDRHMDEDDKKQAEKVFVNLRKAHEILMDPKKRAVYDALGIQGLDAQGWELVTRSSNSENIRKEYDFLQRLKEQELMMQRIHPTSAFVVKSSLVGLFQEDPEERFGPQLLGIAITQSVDCGMTGTDRVGLIGRVKAGNGRGDGSVSAIWKKTAGMYNIENNLTASADVVGLTCRVSRNVFQRAAVIVQPQLQYSLIQEKFVPAMSLIYSMRLRLQWQGSIILSWSPVQSAITTSIVHTENNQPKAVANFTLSPTNSNLRLVYYLRDHSSDATTEMACSLSPFGIAPSIQLEKRLSRFSKVGCALSFTFPSCILSVKFKLKAGQSSFDWHIVLCDDKEALSRSVIYGVALPYFTLRLAKIAFRPWCERIAGLFDDHSQDREVDLAKQEESGRIINLMRPTAERIRKEEGQKHGVIITEAKYGQCDATGSRAYPLPGERTIDVTIPVQSMVNDSQLRIYAVKSQLPGFYDPSPGEPKMLYIRYLFRDEAHLVIVNDDMPLQIPMRAHRLVPNGAASR